MIVTNHYYRRKGFQSNPQIYPYVSGSKGMEYDEFKVNGYSMGALMALQFPT